MDTNHELLFFAISLLLGALGVWIGGLRAHSELQPKLDEERRLKLQLELKRQREEETSTARLAEEQAKLKDATARSTQQEQQLLTKGIDLTQAREKADALEREVADAKHAARELDLQLHAAQTRVGDLDSSLAAERGRLGALQTALDAKQDLVQQLTNELASTNATLTAERTSAEQRETGLRDQIAEHEKFLSSGSSQTDAIRAEMDKVKKAHSTLEQDAEAKAAEASRKLAAADNKIQLLQKEIMSLVNSGGHGDAAEAVVAAENLARAQERAKAAEARVLELEEQLSQGDAGTRKKLRETEYRVCELEFKLAEADEAKAAAVVEALSSLPAPEEPRPEYLAKLHEELAATKQKCDQLIKERDDARTATQGLTAEG